MLIPGWGQAKLDRKLTAGVFLAVEGLAIAMIVKTDHQLDYLRRIGSARVEGKAQQREDWIVLLAFNHALAGIEAYVSAYLWDFPGDLEMRATPNGFGTGIRLPLRLR